jgi:xylulokinase
MDVMVTDSHENTALGAAMIAAWGAGAYDDLRKASERMAPVKRQIASCRENHEIYSRLYTAVYKNMYPAVGEYLITLGNYGLKTPSQGTIHTEES